MEQNVSKTNSPGQYGSDFVRELIQSQNQIYSFILTLVPKWSDAEDILQDTAQILWQKYGQTQEIENFTGLGIRIAQNHIYNYYRKRKSQEQLLDKNALEEIAVYAQELCGDAENRLTVLQQCLAKLPGHDMELIRLHYEKGLTIKKIAEISKRSVTGLYKVVGRIHETIMHCVKRGLIMENPNG